MCLRCGFLEVYSDSMVRRPMSKAEFAALDEDDKRAVFRAEYARFMAQLADP